jgi:hypothetical protein
MMDLLAQLERVGLVAWVRESPSLWGFATVLYLHSIGMATVAGISGVIDLRILGLADMPLARLREALPFMWTGFWVSAASGVLLFSADATTKAASPMFYVKLVAVAAAAAICLTQRHLFRVADPDGGHIPRTARMLAFASIVCWVAAITAGRLLAYVSTLIAEN